MDEQGQRLLIVENDRQLAAFLMHWTSASGYVVQVAGTLSEAIGMLSWSPTLILLDIQPPNGTGVELAERASRVRPAPRIVAMTAATSVMEAFRLGSLGFADLIEKPFSLPELKRTLLRALHNPTNPLRTLGACWGQASLPEMQRTLRQEALKDALARTDGNISQAARLLGVTRQAVQQLLRSNWSG